MNEERQNERDSQLSAMFDGELSAAECELLARRLARDEALRAQWSRYSMIGAALRAERPAVTASTARGAASDRWMRFARPMFGAGIAAGVAAASILWLRSQESPEILAANPIPQTITLAPDTTSTVAVDTTAPAIERV